jgi:[acyl-carrier-protein] S-malonyltransferase
MKTAFVFPGQGSQSVGMMRSFADLAMVRETFAEASDALGEDLWGLVQDGPADVLNQTINTQPAMLAADIALYRAWMSNHGSRPFVTAGHSLGEYSALVAGDAIDFTDAVSLVRYRAQAMQEAVPDGTGAIAAVLGLDDDVVVEACAEASAAGETVEAANFNSPAQVVIAGHKGAVERAMDIAKAKGAKRAMMLPMSVPSHCSLMRPAAERMRERLKDVDIRISGVPVLHNANVCSASSIQDLREALVRQLYQPVRWVDTIRSMLSAGAMHIVECGPGRVLAGLNKRIAPGTPVSSFADAPAFQEALIALK